jgi:hypothetical protein
MPRRRLVIALLVLLAALAACDANVTETCIGGPCTVGPGGGCGIGPAEGDYPCDVFTVIDTYCLVCHTSPPVAGAPFPLLTYEDTQQPFSGGSTLVYQQMHDQIQPGAVPRMPFMSPPLPSAAFATLDGWLTQCALPVPAGTGCGCPGKECTVE